jgi:hypothetical protein
MENERQKCKYPMSNFYNFEDEVPKGTRVSTPEECETCDETECSLKYCLITEDNYRKCFNHCPKCNAGDEDIEWGSKEQDGTSAWQEAVCNKCGCEFHEVYEYSTTMIKK